MKWIFIFIGWMGCFSAWGQGEERFWYSQTNDYQTDGILTWSDSTGVGWSIVSTFPKNGWRPKDSLMSINNRDTVERTQLPVGLNEMGYQVATYNGPEKLTIAPLFGRSNHMYLRALVFKRIGKHLYFISRIDSFGFDSSVSFYGQSINFGKAYGPDYGLQVIKTDLQLHVLQARRYKGNTAAESYSLGNISEDDKGRLQFSMRRTFVDFIDSFRLEGYAFYEDSTVTQYNIVRLRKNLNLDTVVSIQRPQAPSFTVRGFFSLGMHLTAIDEKNLFDGVYLR